MFHDINYKIKGRYLDLGNEVAREVARSPPNVMLLHMDICAGVFRGDAHIVGR